MTVVFGSVMGDDLPILSYLLRALTVGELELQFSNTQEMLIRLVGVLCRREVCFSVHQDSLLASSGRRRSKWVGLLLSQPLSMITPYMRTEFSSSEPHDTTTEWVAYQDRFSLALVYLYHFKRKSPSFRSDVN